MNKFSKTLAIATLATLGLTGVASACCKAQFQRTKPHVNVGTIGHVDHGKTTLRRSTGGNGAAAGMGQKFQQSPSAARQSELVVIVTPYLTRPSK